MKILYISSYLIVITFLSWRCNFTARIKILPLHPYSASQTDFDSSAKKSNSMIAKYFFVQGSVNAGQKLCDTVDVFVKNYLKNNPVDFENYGGYEMFFFRETSELNSKYRDRGTDDSPYSHFQDLLVRYVWSHKEFLGRDIYRNGKVTETIENGP